jgi:hypothetical protein
MAQQSSSQEFQLPQNALLLNEKQDEQDANDEVKEE